MMLANVALVALIPVLVVLGLKWGGWAAPALGFAVALGSGWLGWRRGLAGRVLPVTVAALSAVSLIAGSGLPLRYYPVAVSAAFACGFAWSLYRPPSAIERIARLTSPALSPAAVRYTRKVTWVWLAFFVINGGIALWTAHFGTQAQWLLYNGLLSYLLIAAIFAVEWLVRQRVRDAHSDDEAEGVAASARSDPVP